MGFAKCRRSIKKINKGQWAALMVGLSVCFLAGIGGQAKAQISDLTAPQKQSVTFTFGLGSAELSERYGGNAAAMTKFDKLIRQLAGSSSAHIDSIVVVSYASSANQLGSVDVAERRIDAVKAYIDPLIRQSQLRQAVVVTGNVVTKNNIMMPEQVFEMLKRATVTVYMNGVLMADAGRTNRGRGIGSEEQRNISPFGNNETDVFGRSTAKTTAQKSTSTVIEPAKQQIVTDRPADNSIFPQRTTETQAPVQQPAVQQQPTHQQAQQQVIVPATPAVQPAPVAQQQPTQPVQQERVPQQSQQTWQQQQQQSVVDAELQRYIDSLAATINMDELSTGPEQQVPVQETTVPAVPVAPVVATQPQPVVKQPQAPVITEEEPCPEDRDPEIHDLIRRMLLEEAALNVATGNEQSQQQQPTTTILEQQPQQAQQAQKPGKQVVAFEVVAGTGEGTDMTSTEQSRYAATKEPKVKPAKEPKAKPVKPVKVQREPMTLIRPLVGVKTNLAYWAAVAANLEVEFYFADRWSAALEGVYTNWDMNLYKKHYAVNEISPEVRYWFGRRLGQYRGLYLGVYGHAGQFDYMFKTQDTGNTGDYYGVGLSLGGYLPFTRHFGMELGLRGGWIHAGDYDRYYYDAPQNKYIYKSSHTKNYFGLTGAKVSLVYRFGLGRQ